jgi:hypothetical protein
MVIWAPDFEIFLLVKPSTPLSSCICCKINLRKCSVSKIYTYLSEINRIATKFCMEFMTPLLSLEHKERSSLGSNEFCKSPKFSSSDTRTDLARCQNSWIIGLPSTLISTTLGVIIQRLPKEITTTTVRSMIIATSGRTRYAHEAHFFFLRNTCRQSRC